VSTPRPGIYAWSTGSGGVHHYRQAEPLRVAAALGIPAATGNQLDDEVCAAYDTILVHMLWHPTASEAWEKLAAGGRHRLVLDVDDAMWAPDAWRPFREHYTPDVLDRLYRNLRLAHVVTTPSEVLAEQLAGHNPNVHVCPNTVPAYLLQVQAPPRVAPVVGFQGSQHHLVDFTDQVWDQLVGFLHDSPGWQLHSWGAAPDDETPMHGWTRPGGPLGPELLPGRMVEHPWRASVRRYYLGLSMDIGIGPLAPTMFNACKSSLRAVEYAALGIPAVLSDEPPYRGWVDDGVTGVLISRDQSWRGALTALARDPAARASMSARARDRAADWTTERNITRWLTAWNSA
jgi:hypothetical protein